jgi:hypothetical protein
MLDKAKRDAHPQTASDSRRREDGAGSSSASGIEAWKEWFRACQNPRPEGDGAGPSSEIAVGAMCGQERGEGVGEMGTSGEMCMDDGVYVGEVGGGQKSASPNVPPRSSSSSAAPGTRITGHKTRRQLRPPPLIIFADGMESKSSSATSRHRRATVSSDFSHRLGDTELRSPPRLSPIASIPLMLPAPRLPSRNSTAMAVTPPPRIDPPPRHSAKSPLPWQSSQSEWRSSIGTSTANEEMRACGREKHQHGMLRSILRCEWQSENAPQHG